jgi:hypothetical protein
VIKKSYGRLGAERPVRLAGVRLPARPPRTILTGCLVALLLAVSSACGDDDNDVPQGDATPPRSDVEEELFDDVEGLADALAAGNYERVYDDFVSAACQSLVDGETFVQNLREAQAQIEGTVVQVDEVEVLAQESADRIEARVDFTIVVDGMATPRDPAAPPNIEAFVFEDGHWRSTECLGFTVAPTAAP